MRINPNDLEATATLTFAEEFDKLTFWNGQSGLDTRPGFATGSWADQGFTWTGTLDTWYVQPTQNDLSARGVFHAQDGILTITAKQASETEGGGHPYVSGTLTTFHTFSQTYGYFEVRAMVDAKPGTLPAFWMLPTSGTWPPELDVMEVLGSRTSEIATTVHTRNPGDTKVGDGHYRTGNVAEVADTSKAFHTYGVDWQRDTLVWYYDGVKIFETATPIDLHEPMYMIANLNVGGNWEGYPASPEDFSAEFKIDYMRAYQNRSDVSVPIVPAPNEQPNTTPSLIVHTTVESVPGAFPDKVIIRVAGDSFDGSPQFVVRVNGQFSGEIHSVQASHRAGEYEDIVVDAGQNDVQSLSIEFINDAYGGSSDFDRNLYVDKVSLNEVTYEAEQATIVYGPAHFNATEAALFSNAMLKFDIGFA
jgi:beta-glucanase (GH16 family)